MSLAQSWLLLACRAPPLRDPSFPVLADDPSCANLLLPPPSSGPPPASSALPLTRRALHNLHLAGGRSNASREFRDSAPFRGTPGGTAADEAGEVDFDDADGRGSALVP
jgi:hypothetical protein